MIEQNDKSNTKKMTRLCALYSWNVFALNKFRIASSCHRNIKIWKRRTKLKKFLSWTNHKVLVGHLCIEEDCCQIIVFSILGTVKLYTEITIVKQKNIWKIFGFARRKKGRKVVIILDKQEGGIDTKEISHSRNFHLSQVGGGIQCPLNQGIGYIFVEVVSQKR